MRGTIVTFRVHFGIQRQCAAVHARDCLIGKSKMNFQVLPIVVTDAENMIGVGEAKPALPQDCARMHNARSRSETGSA